MKKSTPLWILVGLVGIIVIVMILKSWNASDHMMDDQSTQNDAMREHCQMMPEMQGCEEFRNSKVPTMMNHGAMITSEEAFVVNMIPHHQEAVDTARLVLAKGENPDLKKLAESIITAQEREIAMMNQWKVEWKYSTISPTYQNMMGDGTKLSGKELDQWFLHGMIMHHSGAIQMAEAILKFRPRSEIATFAQAIIRDQSREIDQMKGMLDMKGGSMMN